MGPRLSVWTNLAGVFSESFFAARSTAVGMPRPAAKQIVRWAPLNELILTKQVWSANRDG